MKKYLDLKKDHQAEVNAFPIGFAFSDNQFKEAMIKLGLNPAETDKICSIGAGGFIRKTDKQAFIDMMDRHELEIKDAYNDAETGEQFAFEMFNYELSNHEYCVTYEIEDTLNALGLSYDEVVNNENLRKGLKRAKEAQYKEYSMF